MRKDEPPHAVTPGGLGDRERLQVTAHATPESNRPVPARRFGEHESAAGGPCRELEELGRPDHSRAAGPDQVAEGRVVRMRHSPALDDQPPRLEGARIGNETLCAGQFPDPGHELALLVRHEPGSELPAGGCSGAAIDHHPDARPGEKQSRRRIARRGQRTDAKGHEPQLVGPLPERLPDGEEIERCLLGRQAERAFERGIVEGADRSRA